MKPLTSVPRIALRRAAQWLSPGGSRGSLLVLIFHRVLPHFDELLPDEPDATRFAAQMDVLAALFNVLPLTEAVARLKNGSLPPRAACITFDDGYTNNLTVALPILQARKLPATVFVSTGFSAGGRMWNDTLIETVRNAGVELDLERFDAGRYRLDSIAARRAAVEAIIGKMKYLDPFERRTRVEQIAEHVGRALPNDLMMDEAQLRELHAQCIEIGAHTVNHPILTRLDDEAARREILDGKRHLEEIIGARVTSFAYPNGRPQRDYEARHVKLVRECGFDLAVSTAWGAARKDSDIMQIPRVAPWDRTSARFGLRLVKAYLDPDAAVA